MGVPRIPVCGTHPPSVANHWLIIVIRFVAKSYIHLWKDFANRLHLVHHTCEILFSKNVRARICRMPNRMSWVERWLIKKQKQAQCVGSVQARQTQKATGLLEFAPPVCACVHVFELSQWSLKWPWFVTFCGDAISELSEKCTVDCRWN